MHHKRVGRKGTDMAQHVGRTRRSVPWGIPLGLVIGAALVWALSAQGSDRLVLDPQSAPPGVAVSTAASL